MSFGYQILGFGSGGPTGPKWMEATGGTLVSYTDAGVDYNAHYYLATSTFVATVGSDPSHGDKVDYFVTGSGGGGGGHIGGGGGAGGSVVTSGLATAITSGTHPVTIGALASGGGGAGDVGNDSVVFVGAPFVATGVPKAKS